MSLYRRDLQHNHDTGCTHGSVSVSLNLTKLLTCTNIVLLDFVVSDTSLYVTKALTQFSICNTGLFFFVHSSEMSNRKGQGRLT